MMRFSLEELNYMQKGLETLLKSFNLVEGILERSVSEEIFKDILIGYYKVNKLYEKLEKEIKKKEEEKIRW